MDNQNVPEKRKHKKLRLLLILGVSVLATAAIGFGGLAAWTVTTQNNGSTFSTGTVHHSNLATVSGGAGVSCTDQAGVCGIIFTSLANQKPGSPATTGTVKIVNTGSLTSTFVLTEASAVTSGAGVTLCHDLNLSIVGNDAGPTTYYNSALDGLGATPLKQSGASLNWANLDTGTYTFSITLPGSASTDMGSTCTAAFTWSQTNT